MKLLPKFALLSVAVCAVPMAVAGLSATRIGESAVREAIFAHESTIASQAAEQVGARLERLLGILRVETRVLDMSQGQRALPRPEVLRGFLQLCYQQSPEWSLVLFMDGAGKVLGPPAYAEIARTNTALGSHEPMRADDVGPLVTRVPIADVLRDGVAVSDVFPAGAEGTPQVALAIRYDFHPEQPPVILVGQVALTRLFEAAALGHARERDEEAGRRLALLDRNNRVLAGHGARWPAWPGRSLPAEMTNAPPDRTSVATYDGGGERLVGAFARTDPFPLAVLVERSLGATMAPVRRMRLANVYWMTVSGLLAAVVAAVLARGLSRRAADLAQGARRIAQGKLDVQLAVRSNDELGELARAFNAMSTSLETARDEILRQTREIKAWNESLERRVDEKTKELRDAQDMLLRARSLAALGGLGAGVAHEINNPLTGILGMAQLLLQDLPEDHPARPMIADVESQAVRIQAIVANLLRLAERQSGEDFRPLDLSEVIRDALELCGPSSLAEAGIKVDLRVPSPSPPIRGSAVALQTALIQIIQNACAAMDGGGTLTLETSLPEAKILRLRVTDTGRGIKPEHLPRIFEPFFTTKAQGKETGLGLAVVHKIAIDHGGSIRAESEVGKGTTFWLSFPIDVGPRHLT